MRLVRREGGCRDFGLVLRSLGLDREEGCRDLGLVLRSLGLDREVAAFASGELCGSCQYFRV